MWERGEPGNGVRGSWGCSSGGQVSLGTGVLVGSWSHSGGGVRALVMQLWRQG